MSAEYVTPLERKTRSHVAPKWRKAKNKILPLVLQEMNDCGFSDLKIARKTGITTQTLRKWRNNKTKHPSSGTLNFVLTKLGKKFQIVG